VTVGSAVHSSTVRRHPQQGKFLLRVGSQTRVIGLEGQIFFGTTSGVEASIRGLLDSDMRYLVLDFTRVYGALATLTAPHPAHGGYSH
jgi:SulP family sulfate permease